MSICFPLTPLISGTTKATEDLNEYVAAHMQTVLWSKTKRHSASHESHQQSVTYIFIELGETGGEVEDRGQVSAYIACNFH